MEGGLPARHDPRGMGATGYWGRVVLRRHLGGVVLLSLLAGLGLGFATVALTGARRADRAYDRLREASLAPDAFVDNETVDEIGIDRLAALPEVEAISGFGLAGVTPAPLTPFLDGVAFVGSDAAFLRDVYAPVAIEGRLADPAAGDEVVVNEVMAEAADLQAGDRVDLVTGDQEGTTPLGPATVVGVVRGSFDVGANAGNATMLLTKGFADAHRDRLQVSPGPGVLVRLDGGTGQIDAFTDAASELAGRPVMAGNADEDAKGVDRTLSVQTIALGTLGLIAGAATIAAVAQSLARLLDGPLADLGVLGILGVAPRRRRRLGLWWALPVVALSSVVAVVVTLLGTPRVPTGFARTVDPDVGVHLDALVLVGVLGLSAVVLVGTAVLAGHRASLVRAARPEPSRGLLAMLPLRPRFGSAAALAPVRVRAGAAARSALFAGVLAVAAVAGVMTYTASLDHLTDHRELEGWDFDAALSASGNPLPALREATQGIEDDPAVDAVGWATIGTALLDGAPVEGFAFHPDAGSVGFTLRSGRPALADDEIVLGNELARVGGVSIGDTVEVSGAEGSAELEVVGIGPFPEIGNSKDLASSYAITAGAARRIGFQGTDSVALVRLAPGASPDVLDGYGDPVEVVRPFESTRVRNLGEIGGVPLTLALFVALLGLAAVVHSLVRSVQARRHDLAVLESLGLRRRDLVDISVWQGLTVSLVALVVGIPVGYVLARLAWSATAASAGIVEVVVAPLGRLSLIVPVTIALWLLAAGVVARVVLRGHVVDALHAD